MICPSILLLLLAGPSPGTGDGAETAVRRHGRVVCLDQELHPVASAPAEAACNEPDAARFAFDADDGERLVFLPHDPRAEMFLDPEVRAKELVVEGWPRPEGRFELLHVYSIKEGRLHDLHYRCDLCNITASGPGPCWCCGQPFELREVPIDRATDVTPGLSTRADRD